MAFALIKLSRVGSTTRSVILCALLAQPGFGDVPACQIDTIAGGGNAPQDATGPAVEASLGWPAGIAVAADETAYFADRSNWRIRKILPDGTIETIAGSGLIGWPADGDLALGSPVTEPVDVALGPSGDLYIATRVTSQVLRIDSEGRIRLVAGTGNQACYLPMCGEGILATEAETPFPRAIEVDSRGVVSVAHDLSAAGIGANIWIRQVGLDGRITTLFPNGGIGPNVVALAMDPEDRLLIATFGQPDVFYSRLENNILVPFKSTKLYLRSAQALAAAPDGGFYVADGGFALYRLTPDGRVYVVAGQSAVAGFAGDGGPAAEALFGEIMGLDVSPTGDLWISDKGNARVRRISQVADCPLAPAPLIPNSIPFDTSDIGVYRNGSWMVDTDSNGTFDESIDQDFAFGFDGAQPLKGDWNGDGTDEAGLFRDGFWFLDYDGDGLWHPGSADKQFEFGWEGVAPVVGDWNGDGRETIGIFIDGFWYLDADGNGVWNGAGPDIQASFGWEGVTPLIGDWNGDGRAKIGVFVDGFWFLDSDGDGKWEAGSADLQAAFGWPGVTPFVGDWNGNGRDTIAIYVNGYWFLDGDGNGIWDGPGPDIQASFGFAGATPIQGDWNGDGREKVGVFFSGLWYLDYDGSASWDGGALDRSIQWGSKGAKPIVGRW